MTLRRFAGIVAAAIKHLTSELAVDIVRGEAAKYMKWSVIAIAITSGLNALFAFLTWYAPHIPK